MLVRDRRTSSANGAIISQARPSKFDFGFWVGCLFMDGKYTIELCRPGGEGAGIERVFARQDDLTIARKLYRTIAKEYPDRVVMLCDRGRVLARSDRPDTMPD